MSLYRIDTTESMFIMLVSDILISNPSIKVHYKRESDHCFVTIPDEIGDLFLPILRACESFGASVTAYTTITVTRDQ